MNDMTAVTESEDIAEIRRAVQALCAEFPGEYWRAKDSIRAYPAEFVDALTKSGFLAALIPEAYGGSGLNLAAAAVIMEEIQAAGCNGASAHAQMYIMNTLLKYGSEDQKRTYLPGIASGELRLQAFGVSEPTSGTDTLSLARLGARVTGLDLSPASVEQARRLAERAGPPVDYVVADVYSAPKALAGRRFDLVYTGIGAICWLPDIDRWARVVEHLLRPGGRLFIREGHPMLWAVDERRTDALTVGYPYFETAEPVDEEDTGTYVDTDAEFEHNRGMTWNHGLGETVTALLDRGLEITGLAEHRSVPWDALPGAMVRGADDEWRLADHPERMPLEIDPVIAQAISRQRPPLPGQAPEGSFLPHQFRRKTPELPKHQQLQILGELGQLSGAGRIEDDLERLHLSQTFHRPPPQCRASSLPKPVP